MKIDLNELFKEKTENLLINSEEEYFDEEDIYAFDIDEEDVLDFCKEEFGYQIKERGKEYYEEGKIESLHKCGNKYIAKVDGSHYETYDVNVEINHDAVDYSCSCPYEFPCKHEYAVLIAISEKEYIEVELKEEIKETEEQLITLLEKIPAEEIKNYLLSPKGKENTIFNILSFHNHFRNYLPIQSYDYYYNKLYNTLLLEEDYEYITERYLNIVNQYLVSENYQEGFKIIKAIIEAYNDSGALNFDEELIDYLLKIGMYLRIIIRKSAEILKNEINEWKQNLEENNYYNNIYLEDIILSAN